MASLGNLTYNITVNDEALKEIEKLQLTVNGLQDRVFLLEQFSIKTQLDNEGRFVISGATGEMIAKYVEDKYKEMLAEQESSTEKAQDAEGLLKRFTSLISETSLGQNVCCGMGVGIGTKPPFTVHQGQVYINQAYIKEPQPFIVVNGETYVSSTRLSELGVTFQGGKDTNGSVVVQSDDYSSTLGWKFDNSNGDFEFNSDTTKIKKTEDVVSVFDENGTLRTRIQL